MTGKFRDSVRQRQRKPHPQTAQRAVGEGQLSAVGGHRVADDGQPQAVASDPLIQAAAALQHLLAA